MRMPIALFSLFHGIYRIPLLKNPAIRELNNSDTDSDLEEYLGQSLDSDELTKWENYYLHPLTFFATFCGLPIQCKEGETPTPESIILNLLGWEK